MKVWVPNPLISVQILSFEIQLLSHGMGVGGRNCISLWREIKNCVMCYEILIMLLKSGTKLSSFLFPAQLYPSTLFFPLLSACLPDCLYFLAFLFPLQDLKVSTCCPGVWLVAWIGGKEKLPCLVFFISHFFLNLLIMGYLQLLTYIQCGTVLCRWPLFSLLHVFPASLCTEKRTFFWSSKK